MELLIVAISSYLLGSIPFGFILTKIFLKKDIREIGSGNIGATNVLRTGNKLIGYGTLILDIFKAVIPVLIIKYQYPEFLFLSSLSFIPSLTLLNFWMGESQINLNFPRHVLSPRTL